MAAIQSPRIPKPESPAMRLSGNTTNREVEPAEPQFWATGALRTLSGLVSGQAEPTGMNLPITPFHGKFRAEYSALPRIKDNKTIRVTDEDAPEESRGQQSIFLGR